MPSPDRPDNKLAAALDQTFEKGVLYSVRASIAAHATALGVSERQVGHLVLIASELVTNAISHGGGRGRLRVWRDGPSLYCAISDEGPGIPEPESKGLEPPPAAAHSGRGLWVARTLADAVTIDTGSGGTTVTVTMLIKPED